MTDFTALAESYIAVWNETDPAARRALIDEVYAPNGSYVDPLVDAEGREAIDATIGAVQAQFAGLIFTLGTPVDAHHNVARFTWNLGPAGAEPIVVGFDVLVVTAEGQIQNVHGFLDKVPAAV